MASVFGACPGYQPTACSRVRPVKANIASSLRQAPAMGVFRPIAPGTTQACFRGSHPAINSEIGGGTWIATSDISTSVLVAALLVLTLVLVAALELMLSPAVLLSPTVMSLLLVLLALTAVLVRLHLLGVCVQIDHCTPYMWSNNQTEERVYIVILAGPSISTHSVR